MERPPRCPLEITTSTATPRVLSVVPSARRMSTRVALAASGRPRSTFQHPVAFLWSLEAARFRVDWTRHGLSVNRCFVQCLVQPDVHFRLQCHVRFVCAVDGADYALTDRDLSAGGTCSFGMTAVDVPVLRVGSSTPRLLVLTKMKEPTTRSARKKKVNVDLRCRDTRQNYQGREISVRNNK